METATIQHAWHTLHNTAGAQWAVLDAPGTVGLGTANNATGGRVKLASEVEWDPIIQLGDDVGVPGCGSLLFCLNCRYHQLDGEGAALSR